VPESSSSPSNGRGADRREAFADFLRRETTGGKLLLAATGLALIWANAFEGSYQAFWETKTSFVPFAALISGKATWRAAVPGWIALIGGLLLWLAITWYHSPMVSPIGGLGRTLGAPLA